MNGLVPTFGIDKYADKLERMLAFSPREMALVEDAILFGMGFGAAVLILAALFRRSPVAVVSFSLVALGGLVVGEMFGELDFVPPGTLVLILCLFCCSALLFTTATFRVARENPFIGALILVVIAGLLAVGGASAVGVIDGGGFARLGVAITVVLVLLFVVIELVRRDGPSLVVAPGVVMAALSPLAMSLAAGQTGEQSWLMTAMPVMLLSCGVFYAALAAQFTVTVDRSDVPMRVANVAPVAAGLGVGVPLLREVEDDVQAGDLVQPRRREPVPPEPAAQDMFAQEPVAQPAPAQDTAPAHEPQYGQGFPTRDAYQPPASQQGSQYAAAQPVSFAQVAGALDNPAEPVSAQWGGDVAGAGMMAATVADDEYVWDMMAEQEVKMGGAFADLFALHDGRTASPDVLRDMVDPASLHDFDEALLGGSEPRTGRFAFDATTARGDVVRLDGRRQVDQDGILMRVEIQVEKLAAASAAAAPLSVTRGDADMAPLTAGALVGGVVQALENGEIEAHFQPIVRLTDRKTIGFEALARWRKSDGTLAEAGSFIEEIVKEGHGLHLAQLVIDQAAAELSAWVTAEPGQGQFVSVNISATDLPKDGLADIIAAAVETYQLPAGALVVELTEDRIQASQSKAMAAAKSVRAAGASLAIDDFGVGYSTLNRLSKFKFDLVKLDKSVVEDLTKSKKKRSFIKAILSTAGKTGIPIIAEGIEDEETGDILRELGCDFGQGYLYGAPEPVNAHATPDPSTGQSAAAGHADQSVAELSQPAAPASTSRVGNLR